MRGYIHEDGMESGVHRKMHKKGSHAGCGLARPRRGGVVSRGGEHHTEPHNPNRRASRDRPTFSTCPQSVFVSGITRNELAGDVRHSPGARAEAYAQSSTPPPGGW